MTNSTSKIPLSKILFTLLLSVIIIEAIYFVFIAPRLTLQKIILNSDIDLTDEQLLALVGLEKGAKFYNLDKQKIEETLTSSLSLSSITVKTQWPNTLAITLNSQQAIARVALSQGSFYLIDALGDLANPLGQNVSHLPLIIGFNKNEGESKTLNSLFLPLLGDLAFLKNKHGALFNQLQSLTLQQIENNYQLMVQFKRLPYKVLWPERIDYRRLYNSLVVVHTLNELGLYQNQIIDMRTDEIVVGTNNAT